jgi:hypothetical protein
MLITCHVAESSGVGPLLFVSAMHTKLTFSYRRGKKSAVTLYTEPTAIIFTGAPYGVVQPPSATHNLPKFASLK